MLQSDGQIFCSSIARQIPANREENKEFSPIRAFFGKIRTENMCEFSSLQDEFPAQQNRELIRDNRELIPPYQAGTGTCLKPIRSRLSCIDSPLSPKPGPTRGQARVTPPLPRWIPPQLC